MKNEKIIISQNGVALITALLVVALATIAAVAMTTRQQLDIRRTANLIHGEQLYMYALGGESLAKHLLSHDKKILAKSIPPLSIPDGKIYFQLEDLQGHFNLNNLVKKGKASPKDIILFKRLLRTLELSPELANVVVDWIDSDMDRLPNGAEDNTYLIGSNKTSYRTSNTLFSSPSEVRLLAGFDNESYLKLLPYISTLPTRTPINVNTAPLEVLMALAEGLNETDATTIIADTDKKPFNTVSDFVRHPALAGLTPYDNLSVESDYFLLTIDLERIQLEQGRILERVRILSSVLHRHSNKFKVIKRSQGGEL
ncbi:type II secretion system minor pseudopilin GspK [Candidatus Parabeggiatoa sp. HSG14]|uniref:type II secretion system minor pseudopilin GspK n=1 Tax=Candidatus Parabeggiatoa sp. HSG14 TaxID=3055593 RepID=UPI0025A86993|nr:type II secretion system minor pseudopilin GspK [Thiotrichales bacterium HSG14]